MFPPLQWDGLRSLLIMSAALATARNFETRHSIQYNQQENIMSRLITFLHAFKLIVSGDIAAYQITAASLLSACCHRFQQSWRQSTRFEASMTLAIFLKDQHLEMHFIDVIQAEPETRSFFQSNISMQYLIRSNVLGCHRPCLPTYSQL